MDQPNFGRDWLNPWAPVINTVGAEEQRRIIGRAAEMGISQAKDPAFDIPETEYRAISMACFCKHADKLDPAVRDELAVHIMEFPGQKGENLEAFCHLAKHLDLYSESRRKEIVSAILKNLNTEFEENHFAPWHMQPEFLAVEALHHLQRHRGRDLPGPEWKDVDKAVAGVLEDDDMAKKSQLIAWMSEDKRIEHVGLVLSQAKSLLLFEAGIELEPGGEYLLPTKELLALTARVDDLSQPLRSRYLDIVGKMRIDYESCEIGAPITLDNIQNNLESFETKERSAIVGRQLKLIGNEGVDPYGDISPRETFKELANVSHMLCKDDMISIVSRAERIASSQSPRGRIGSGHGNWESLRASYAETVRCVSNWCSHAIERAQDRQETAVHEDPQRGREAQDQASAERSHSQSSSETRQRLRSSSR